MNLSKLFEMQKKLDEKILERFPHLQNEDLLPKKILALQVELGELCNCWRGFKYWSNDQKPKTEELGECPLCKGTGDLGTVWAENCIECGGSGKAVVKNPLLEEYVDCLHFILSIGLEHYPEAVNYQYFERIKNKTIVEQFIFITTKVGTLLINKSYTNYFHVVNNFLGLGEMLGFTWEQVEQAYMSKNVKNHAR